MQRMISRLSLVAVLAGAPVARAQDTAVSAPPPQVEAHASPRAGLLFMLLRGEPSLGVDVGGAMGVGALWRELEPGVGARVNMQADLPLLSFLRMELGLGLERMGRSAASADGGFVRLPLYATSMVRAPSAWSVRPYARGGVGAAAAMVDGVRGENNFDPLLHAGGGLLFPLGRLLGDPRWEGRLDVTYNAQFQSRTGNFVLVSLGAQRTFVFDADGDGIDDEADRCVREAEDKDAFADEDGCPELDNDDDAVLDLDDGCPLEPEDRDAFQDEDGCLEPDNDGDKLADGADACPNEPEDLDTFADEDGCPDDDNDNDTLVDRRDSCPLDAEDRDSFQDADGCPDLDNDQDGFADTADACPLQPEDKNGFKDDDGCPDAADDRDQDAIVDKADACADQPEDRDGFEDQDGCPEPDNDRDFVVDASDACPNEPEDADGIADADGCWEGDYDLDGIRDEADKCPLIAEVINGVDDDDGCADEGATLVELKAERIDIKEKIFFKTDSDEIDERSFGLLAQLGALLTNHGELTRVRIEGHTDDSGGAEYNQKLSQQRAEAVRAHLVGRGIDGARLLALGLGETRPLANNKSRLGREMNRRVEFLVEEQAKPAAPERPAAPTTAPATPIPAPAAASADLDVAPHKLGAAQSLEALSTSLWGSAVHAPLLLERNPSAGSVGASLPAGTVVAVPRSITYQVLKGDDLGTIAKRLLGKSKHYKLIADASKAVMPDPNKMEVGMVLTIPLVHPEVEKKLTAP